MRQFWICVVASAAAVSAVGDPVVRFERTESELRIRVGDAPFARYVYRDSKILRPYFAEVRALDGTPVTRRHPPREGVDAVDHHTMHPGIWLAFGDISGSDFWRNKATVEHAGFVGDVEEGPGRGRFTVRNHYDVPTGILCEEEQTITVFARPRGIYLLIESKFIAGDKPFYFGDQEEMGLGVRVATPLAVKNGGNIANSAGDRDEAGCWGKTALWADYGGTIDGRRAGIVLMPHPGNFRPSWFHTRDYGFMAANPFGRKAFTGGEESRIEVPARGAFSLAYGVHIYSLKFQNANPAAAYAEYLQLIDWRASDDVEAANDER